MAVLVTRRVAGVSFQVWFGGVAKERDFANIWLFRRYRFFRFPIFRTKVSRHGEEQTIRRIPICPSARRRLGRGS